MVADSGKPHTKPEDNAAATDSDSVNPEDQDKSEAPSSANQGAEQNSAEDKDQEPQAAVGEHCGTDDSLTAYEVGVSYIEPYRGVLGVRMLMLMTPVRNCLGSRLR